MRTPVRAGSPPARTFTGPVWRQCAPDRRLLDLRTPARFAGRYHRKGGAAVWYAALTERAAWAEVFRHQMSDELSPFEILRRTGRARIRGLRVLDLTDAAVRATLQVEREALVSNDLTRCQAIAEWAQREGYEGILAPSAALDGEVILAVFAFAMGKVTAERSRVQCPPRRMAPLVPRIPRAWNALAPTPERQVLHEQLARLLGGRGARSAARKRAVGRRRIGGRVPAFTELGAKGWRGARGWWPGLRAEGSCRGTPWS